MAQQFNPLIKHGFQKFDDYSLPVAGADTLGGVKVGTGLSIDENGVLSSGGGGGGSSPVEIVLSIIAPAIDYINGYAYAIGNLLFFNALLTLDGSVDPTDALFELDSEFGGSFSINGRLPLFVETANGFVMYPGSFRSNDNKIYLTGTDSVTDGSIYCLGVCPISYN